MTESWLFYIHSYFLIFTNKKFIFSSFCIFLRKEIYKFPQEKYLVYLYWIVVFLPDIQFRAHMQEVKNDNCTRLFAIDFISQNHEFSICPLKLTLQDTCYQYNQNTYYTASLLLSSVLLQGVLFYAKISLDILLCVLSSI